MKSVFLCFLGLIFLYPFSAWSREWIETSSWFGRGPITTRFFEVEAERWRIHYVNHGPGSLNIKVMNQDHQSVYEIFTRQTTPRIREVPTDPGDYYLVIEPVDTRWEVKVRQRLTRTQAWFLQHEDRQYQRGLQRFASFSGGPGQTSHTFSVPHGRWQIILTNTRRDRVDFRLTSGGAEGGYEFLRSITSPKRVESWIYRTGDFVLQVSAADTRWRADLHYFPEPQEE